MTLAEFQKLKPSIFSFFQPSHFHTQLSSNAPLKMSEQTTVMDRVNQLHGSILNLPVYNATTFEEFIEEVTFHRFVLDLIRVNNKQIPCRPVAEESWALVCRSFADSSYGKTVISKDGVYFGKDAALYDAYSQVMIKLQYAVPGS